VSSGNQSRGESSQKGGSPDGVAPAATAPAVLPGDLLLAIARTAMATEGHSLHARVRLGLVCQAWRRELAGGPPTYSL